MSAFSLFLWTLFPKAQVGPQRRATCLLGWGPVSWQPVGRAGPCVRQCALQGQSQVQAAGPGPAGEAERARSLGRVGPMWDGVYFWYGVPVPVGTI